MQEKEKLSQYKVLHYQVYESGKIGCCNALMSVENALIIAKLTERDKIIFYCPSTLFNSDTKTLFDLYDINYNYELVRSDLVDNSIESLPYDFHNICIYYKYSPCSKFLNGRNKIINIEGWKNKESFRTLNTNTLSFYSYLFYIKDSKLLSELQEFIRTTVVPKNKYKETANKIVKDILATHKQFNSIAVRRGDYLYINDTNNKHVTVNDFYLDDMDKDVLLLVHTDETNIEYFKDLKYNFWCVQQGISNDYDNVEKGLISLIIASYSTNFTGTLFSTYTSYIQRYRMYNFKEEQFKFLYSQRKELVLNNGQIPKEINEYSWNKLPDSLKSMAFWISEYEECYKTKQLC